MQILTINKVIKMTVVTTEKLKAIPKGGKVTFHVGHPRKLQSARSLAGQTWKHYPELGVRFRCSCNYETSEITIYAEPLQKKKGKAR